MVRLEISPLDQKDILEMLDYAKEQKQLNRPVLKGTNKWDDTQYWVERIEYLKKVILGKVKNDTSIYKSSLEYYDRKENNND